MWGSTCIEIVEGKIFAEWLGDRLVCKLIWLCYDCWSDIQYNIALTVLQADDTHYDARRCPEESRDGIVWRCRRFARNYLGGRSRYKQEILIINTVHTLYILHIHYIHDRATIRFATAFSWLESLDTNLSTKLHHSRPNGPLRAWPWRVRLQLRRQNCDKPTPLSPHMVKTSKLGVWQFFTCAYLIAHTFLWCSDVICYEAVYFEDSMPPAYIRKAWMRAFAGGIVANVSAGWKVVSCSRGRSEGRDQNGACYFSCLALD